MKITVSQLRKIIKEEIKRAKTLSEDLTALSVNDPSTGKQKILDKPASMDSVEMMINKHGDSVEMTLGEIQKILKVNSPAQIDFRFTRDHNGKIQLVASKKGQPPSHIWLLPDTEWHPLGGKYKMAGGAGEDQAQSQAKSPSWLERLLGKE